MRTALTLLAFVACLTPLTAFACGFDVPGTGTFPLEFIWFGNALAALILLFTRRVFEERLNLHRAFVLSCMIGSAGVGLFVANTVELGFGGSMMTALWTGFFLFSFHVRPSIGSQLTLCMVFLVSSFLALVTFADTQSSVQMKYSSPHPVVDVTF